MNPADTILAQLPDAALVGLATAVEAGWLSGGSPDSAFGSIAGENGAAVSAWVTSLENAEFKPSQIARVLRSVVASRHRDKVLLPDLVVSGPDVPGVPTADTYAVVQSLFQEAQNEIVVAGYAFHNGKLLFERLAEQKKLRPHLRIIFHVDVPRKSGDTSSPEAIILRYADEFRTRHWPWQPFPEVYFDPRALEVDSHCRASLHAKVVVVDRSKLFLSSANFTEAAHQRNIEMGLLSRAAYLAEQVATYFEGLRQSGRLQRLPGNQPA
ncbi:MAG TPA: DISARM system phospholipase D-like protein DrmC [Terriglobia bacterium]|nr:DISARM system phospholipase D-like protein DrmC [Terriglobia bacterium]